MPPDTPPARIVLELVWSIASARVLPPTSVGPTSFQSKAMPSAASSALPRTGGRSASVRAKASSRWRMPSGMVLVDGSRSMLKKYSLLPFLASTDALGELVDLTAGRVSLGGPAIPLCTTARKPTRSTEVRARDVIRLELSDTISPKHEESV